MGKTRRKLPSWPRTDARLGHQHWPSLFQVFTTNHHFELFESGVP